VEDKMNIDREFIKWFYEEEYPELGCNRRQVYAMTHADVSIDVVDYWMREAFKAGANSVLHPQTSDGYELGTIEAQQEFDKQREYPL
jgi:hypothetical protein